MATHSSVLAWRIPWTVEPGRLQSMGSQSRTQLKRLSSSSSRCLSGILAFLMIQQMFAISSLVPLPFLKPAWTSASSRFTYCWSLAWRILSIYFTSVWDECNCVVAWTFFGIAFLWDWNENLFQSCGHCWVFQICWHIVCSTFTASSFRIWNSSNGILSPPLALLVIRLPKAHLISYSRMSGSR